MASWRDTLQEAARRRQLGEFNQAHEAILSFRPANEHEARTARIIAWAHEPFWWRSIEGRRCSLRRRSTQDLELVRSMWVDEKFMWSFNRFARPLPAADRDLAVFLAREHSSIVTEARSVHWTIETKNDHKVGVISFTDISLANRRAEILIGIREYPYLGIAAEAMLLALEFGFCMMRLHRIYSLVYSDNEKARRNAMHIGFELEGRLREHVVDSKTGHPAGALRMGLLRSHLNKPAVDKLSIKLLGRRLEILH